MGEITVKPLIWADKINGQRGTCRSQQDGQIELYTTCGRYVLRLREFQGDHMWMLRYLGFPVSGHKWPKQAREAANRDHEARILSEITLVENTPPTPQA